MTDVLETVYREAQADLVRKMDSAVVYQVTRMPIAETQVPTKIDGKPITDEGLIYCLFHDQSNPADNGIYTVVDSKWKRHQ